MISLDTDLPAVGLYDLLADIKAYSQTGLILCFDSPDVGLKARMVLGNSKATPIIRNDNLEHGKLIYGDGLSNDCDTGTRRIVSASVIDQVAKNSSRLADIGISFRS